MHFIIKDLRIGCDGHEIEELIADNDGYYHASFEFDAAWDGVAKTARFICKDGYRDSLIGPDDTCLVPSEVLYCPGLLQVGVFAGEYGESLLTTNSACVRVIKSILTDSNYGLPDDPDPNIYTQIANMAADALKIAQSVEDRANAGEFNGRDGLDGAVDQTYNPESKNAQSGVAVAQAIESLKNELSYVPIEIKTFTANPSFAEIGSSVKSITLNWTLNKVAQSLKLDGADVGTLTSGSKPLTGLSLTSNKSWTLVAKDEKSTTSSKTVTLSFLKGIYYGVASAAAEITNDLIVGLTKKLQPNQNINQTFTVTPTANQKIIFALPTSDYNDPTFIIGGFEYEWEKVKVFNFTNSSGHTESYTVWRSVQAVAGSIAVTVKASKK